MTNFKDYANYYNLLYKEKDYQSEVDYIESLIKKYSKIKILEILDLGCGTGSHDILLSEKGYKITGIDLSEKMIEIAKSQKNKNADFLIGDVRNINLNKQFDVVVSLFHVASYQTTNEDFENYIKTAYSHLKKDGLFIFDFWYGPAVLTDKPTNRVKRLEDKSIKLTRISEPTFHENENVVDVNFEIIVENKITKIIEKSKEIHRMRYWFLPEMEFFIKKAGFEIIDSYKWLSTSDKLGFDSWNGTLINQKNKYLR